jgi:hypothetical protein
VSVSSSTTQSQNLRSVLVRPNARNQLLQSPTVVGSKRTDGDQQPSIPPHSRERSEQVRTPRLILHPTQEHRPREVAAIQHRHHPAQARLRASSPPGTTPCLVAVNRSPYRNIGSSLLSKAVVAAARTSPRQNLYRSSRAAPDRNRNRTPSRIYSSHTLLNNSSSSSSRRHRYRSTPTCNRKPHFLSGSEHQSTTMRPLHTTSRVQ